LAALALVRLDLVQIQALSLSWLSKKTLQALLRAKVCLS